MKKQFILGTLLSILALGLCACEKEGDDNSIKITDVQNNSVGIVFPRSDAFDLTITGGDGQYEVVSDDEDVVTAEITESGTLSLTAVTTGETTVTVTDKSGNSYSLTVNVHYAEDTMIVQQVYAWAEGEDLSVEDKNAIEETMLASIPVEPGGKYEFTYTLENYAGGDVAIYPKSGGDAITGTFLRQIMTDKESKTYMNFEITIDEEVRNLLLSQDGKFPETRMSFTPRTYYLFEDFTESLKTGYPELEKAYSVQAVTAH